MSYEVLARLNDQDSPLLASQCPIDVCGQTVGISFRANKRELTLESSNAKDALPISHDATCCPFSLDPGSINSNINSYSIAVACIILNNQDEILLTRRGPWMRHFPCRWVPPGGHVDDGETLKQAAVRETKEEVGIDIQENDVTELCVYETCYPTTLEFGQPKKHYIIVYYLIKMDKGGKEELRLQESEVDQAVFLPKSRIRDIVNFNENCQSEIDYFDGKSIKSGKLKLDSIIPNISLGAVFALKVFMESSTNF